MIRPILLLVVFSLAMSAEADDGFGLRSRHFEYPPSVTESMGPAMPREVTIAPAFDRSRAYLLDITEEEIVGRPQAPIRNIWDRIRNGFALPALKGPLVAERELWYRQRKDLVAAISQKSRRYLFHIVEAVEKRGLPMELALLPFVESGFEPRALSTAQAVGLWQFIPGTAQRYRLKLNEQYDARRDIVASTDAALDYLEFLHGMFKDWQLAFAAYNWGEEAVLRAIQRNQMRGLPTSYENLVMPEETRYYLPKLMAIRNIVQSPELHGIELPDIDNVPYFMGVAVAVELDAQTVARLAGLSVAEVLALNPSHKSQMISGKGRPALLLPTDRVEEFSARLSALPVNVRKRDEAKALRRAVVGLNVREGKAL
ncbi:MAG: transglycosylase SLT domain-containing protein [Sulfuritalea sp.]|jgi:membrane-bound lytic murein transglycosylase D|nr:transglycosylase SLT domain-containing protein [Sulfuritalea sp.]